MQKQSKKNEKKTFAEILVCIAAYLLIVFILAKVDVIKYGSTNWTVYIGVAIIVIIFRELSKFLMKINNR